MPAVLLSVYALLKFLGWHYAQGVQELQRQLDGLRPLLSEKAYAEHLQQTRLAYAEAVDQIQRLNLGGERLLEKISQGMPASISIERIDLRSRISLKIIGDFLPGVRPPEEVIVSWAEKLQGALLELHSQGKPAAFRLAIRRLFPSHPADGFWQFELEVLEDA